jgi:hypothetical protein
MSCPEQKLAIEHARCGAAISGCGPAFQRVKPAESRPAGLRRLVAKSYPGQEPGAQAATRVAVVRDQEN